MRRKHRWASTWRRDSPRLGGGACPGSFYACAYTDSAPWPCPFGVDTAASNIGCENCLKFNGLEHIENANCIRRAPARDSCAPFRWKFPFRYRRRRGRQFPKVAEALCCTIRPAPDYPSPRRFARVSSENKSVASAGLESPARAPRTCGDQTSASSTQSSPTQRYFVSRVGDYFGSCLQREPQMFLEGYRRAPWAAVTVDKAGGLPHGSPRCGLRRFPQHLLARVAASGGPATAWRRELVGLTAKAPPWRRRLQIWSAPLATLRRHRARRPF